MNFEMSIFYWLNSFLEITRHLLVIVCVSEQQWQSLAEGKKTCVREIEISNLINLKPNQNQQTEGNELYSGFM